MGLPLHAIIASKYKLASPGHVVAQENPLELKAYWTPMENLQSGAPWVRYAAALVARVLLSCLRFGHVQRATLAAEKTTDRMQVWHISRGKRADRAGYFVATPTHWGWGEPPHACA